jgi:hypothetical protein
MNLSEPVIADQYADSLTQVYGSERRTHSRRGYN